jgi:hypothetical protein
MSPVFKLGAPTVANCGVCGGSVFSDEHVVREGDNVNHAQCVLYPPRRPRSGTGSRTADSTA